MGLFAPAWQSENAEKRLKALEKINDYYELGRIVDSTKHEDVRKIAFNKMEELLKEKAIQDSSAFSIDAVKQITNQSRLVEVAIKSRHESVSKIAIEKITDQTALAQIAINASSGNIRKAAVEKISNPYILAKIAESEIDSLEEAEKSYDIQSKLMRQQGIDVVSKETFLNKIKYQCHDDVRKAAVEKIILSDVQIDHQYQFQNIFAKVVRKDSNRNVRKAAVEKITDQSILAEIAKNDKSSDVRKVVVVKLTDQSVLADVAKNDKDSDVRQVAVEKIILSDVPIDHQYQFENIFAIVALTDSNSNVRKAAVEKITNQSILAKIAKNDNYPDIRSVAIEKLTDQSELADIAKNGNSAAVKKLTNQFFLAKIAKNGDYPDIRSAAIEKLTDQSILVDVAKNSKGIDNRIQAIQKLTNQERIAECVLILLQAIDTRTLDWDSKKWAKALIEIATKSPQPLRIQWEQVKHWIEYLHNDNNHEDHRDTHSDGMSSDCKHTDNSLHTDKRATTEGIIFPPYPFED
jgi:hypothetical protein